MDLTRRCFLQFAGGATAGAIASPLPWKLLDDVSIWTQNGCWVTTPPHGAVSFRYSTCTLCQAGCGVRLRRVGDSTVSTWGVAGHPLSGGRLCPAGLGATQIPFHPARIRGAVCRGRGQNDAWRLIGSNPAIEEVGRKLANLRTYGGAGRVAILDLRPGRSLSVLYRRFLAANGGGHYITLPGGREQSESALGELLDMPGVVPGYDLSQAGAVISFGARITDDWCGGGTVPGLQNTSGSPRSVPYLIQVESNGSVDTDRADSWLPIRPGTEVALALGLVHILRNEVQEFQAWRPSDSESTEGFWAGYEELVASYTPERVAGITGLSPRSLRATAHDLSRHRPALAIGGGNPGGGPLGREEELAIWALNLTLGSVGRPGGIVLRPDAINLFADSAGTANKSLWDVPDGSLDLLLIDGSLPGAALPRGLLRRKMCGPTSLVVGLSPYAAGPSAEADIIIPTNAPGEWLDDVPPRSLAPRASYSFCAATSTAPDWSHHPADLLTSLAEASGLNSGSLGGRAGYDLVLRERIEQLMDTGQGEVFDPSDGKTRSLDQIAWPRKLEKILTAGGCWVGPRVESASALTLRPDSFGDTIGADLFAVAEGRLAAYGTKTNTFPLVVMLAGADAMSQGGILPPVVNKLYRESNLMAGGGQARVNPTTLREITSKKRQRTELITKYGAMQVVLVPDESVMPGVVLMSPGPNPFDLGDEIDSTQNRNNILEVCGASQRMVWRVERAALRGV